MGNEKSDENFLALFDDLILQSLKNLDARDDITFCQKKEPFFFHYGYHLQHVRKDSEIWFLGRKIFWSSVVGGCWRTWFCNCFRSPLLRTNWVSMKNRLYLVLTPGWVVLLQIMFFKRFSTFNWLVLVKNWLWSRRRLKRNSDGFETWIWRY